MQNREQQEQQEKQQIEGLISQTSRFSDQNIDRLENLSKRQLSYKRECPMEKWMDYQIHPEKVLRNHLKGVDAVLFNQSNHAELITGSHDRTIKRWDLEKGDVKSVLNGHDFGIWTIAQNKMQPDIIASGGCDKFLFLWDLRNNKSKKPLSHNDGQVYDLLFSDNGNQVISTNDAKQICIYDIRKQMLIDKITTLNQINYSLCTDGNQKYIGVSSYGGQVAFYDANSLDLVAQYNYQYEHQNRANHLIFDFRASSLIGSKVIVGFSDGIIRVLEFNEHKLRFKLRKEFYAATESISSMAIDSDYKYLVSSSRDGISKVWDLDDFSFQHTLVGHKSNASSCDIVKVEGDFRIATGGWDQNINIYNVQ